MSFDDAVVLNGQAAPSSFSATGTFSIPAAQGSDAGTIHYVVLRDSTTGKTDMAQFTVITARAISIDGARIQEGMDKDIAVSVTGGVASTLYTFDVAVVDPSGGTHHASAQVSTDANGSGSLTISYPSGFPSAQDPNTNFVGSYSATATETSPGRYLSVSGGFTVALTTAAQYPRFDRVSFQSAGWAAREEVMVNLEVGGQPVTIGPDTFPASFMADNQGMVIMTTSQLPASAALGTYSLSLTSADASGTVKDPADVQAFNVVLAGPNAISVAFESQPSIGYERTQTSSAQVRVTYADGTSFGSASLGTAIVIALDADGNAVKSIALTANDYNATEDLWSFSWALPRGETTGEHTFAMLSASVTDKFGNSGPANDVSSDAFLVSPAHLEVVITNPWDSGTHFPRTGTISMELQVVYPDGSPFTVNDLGKASFNVSGQGQQDFSISLTPDDYNAATQTWTAEWIPAYNAPLTTYQFQMPQAAITDAYGNSNDPATSNPLALDKAPIRIASIGTDRLSYERDQTVVLFARAQYLNGIQVTTGAATILLTVPSSPQPMQLTATYSQLHARWEASTFLTVIDPLGGYTVSVTSDGFVDGFGNGPVAPSSNSFQVVKPTEIIQVDTEVGAMYFAGEQAQFTVLTANQGVPVNVDTLSGSLVLPDGSQVDLTQQQLGTGLYRFTYTLPANAAPGTYTLMVGAQVSLELADGKGSVIKSFQVSKSLVALAPTVVQIQNGIADLQTRAGNLQTSVGAIRDELAQIHPMITQISSDTATIKTDTGSLKVALSALDAKVTGVQGGVANIQTTLGTMSAELTAIHGTVTAISDGQATILTDLGTVQASLDSINPKITNINNNVATIQTDVGTVKTDVATIRPQVTSIQGDVATVKTDVGTLKGTVTSMQGDVATVKTNVGTIQARVTDVVSTAPAVQNATVLLYIVAGLALVAAIGAIGAVRIIVRRLAR